MALVAVELETLVSEPDALTTHCSACLTNRTTDAFTVQWGQLPIHLVMSCVKCLQTNWILEMIGDAFFCFSYPFQNISTNF